MTLYEFLRTTKYYQVFRLYIDNDRPLPPEVFKGSRYNLTADSEVFQMLDSKITHWEVAIENNADGESEPVILITIEFN